MRRAVSVILLMTALTCLTVQHTLAQDSALETRLRIEGIPALAQAARREGNAAQGAIIFHQPQTLCIKCHAIDGEQVGLGPDLTALPRDTTDEQLVESVLEPSKVIRKGFELVTVGLTDGSTLTLSLIHI